MRLSGMDGLLCLDHILQAQDLKAASQRMLGDPDAKYSNIVMGGGCLHKIIPACTFVKWSLPS
jgi:hypothetical protein